MIRGSLCPPQTAAFSAVEYQRRIARARTAMATAGIDVLFVTAPSNPAWLTCYDGWSFYVHQGVILAMTGDPVWWGRHMDSIGPGRTGWMSGDHIKGYGDQ